MKKRIDSFRYAFRGIADAFSEQPNIRIHFIAAGIAVLLSAFLHLNTTEWCIILFCCGLVISMELLNTAIEKLCDFAEPQRNEKIRIIKDVSAAAVLVASIVSLAIGLVIFVPKIVQMVSNAD
ncbi:MAG: diacylglycerol kinase [Bacteroidetes bacterium]|jgi:diacylglycerol kinase|nr:diacylglycerol kinase [Bacteroidota bacterium]